MSVDCEHVWVSDGPFCAKCGDPRVIIPTKEERPEVPAKQPISYDFYGSEPERLRQLWRIVCEQGLELNQLKTCVKWLMEDK